MMFRFLYRGLLCLHPKRFRKRFQQEMLSIFDCVKERSTGAQRLLDGFLSLLRQWVWRSGNREERLESAAPAEGMPFFYTVNSFQPRTRALIHGAILTVIAFWGVCLVLGYNWTHPVLIPFAGVQLDRNAGPEPERNQGMSATLQTETAPLKQKVKPYRAETTRYKVFRRAPLNLSSPAAHDPQLTSRERAGMVEPSSLVSVPPNVAIAKENTTAQAVLFIPVAKDVKLEVLDWGGAGRPLILLAGMGNTAHVFDHFAPKLAVAFHVYGITRRGFGASSIPPDIAGNYSADRLGDDVLAVIDSLRLRRPLLVGHSIAGEELSSIGSRHPEKIGGLVYLDAGYSYAFYDRARGDLILDSLELGRNLKQLNARGKLEDRKHAVRGLLAALPRFERELRAYQTDLESLPEFGEPAFPVTAVVQGEQKYTNIRGPILAIFAVPPDLRQVLPDNPRAHARLEASLVAMTSAQVKAFESGLPSARVVRLPHASHFVFESNEAQVLEEIKTFANTLPRN